jgi:hypothetical protein
MLPVQIGLVIFLAFAVSRVYLRLKSRSLRLGEFLFWIGLWLAALVGILFPEFTTYVAKLVGIGRGADVVVYGAIMLLFYMVFRLNVMLEEVRHEITRVVREVAVGEYGIKYKKSNIKNKRIKVESEEGRQ